VIVKGVIVNTYWVEISIASDWLNWSESFQGITDALISDSQYARAQNVLPGDILLHYIKGIHCWSGYSTVLKPAERVSNPQNEWEKAYPYRIQIKPTVYLKEPEELILTQRLPGLSHQSWHRKSYVKVTKPEDTALIMKAIDDAHGATGEIDASFREKLIILRDANQTQTCKKSANYRCELCGATDSTWCANLESLGLNLGCLENETKEPGWFLHAHHIMPVSKGGDADLDNLLCLCPNCHQVVHRLGHDELQAILNKLKSPRASFRPSN